MKKMWLCMGMLSITLAFLAYPYGVSASFDRVLTRGMTGSDVEELQGFLRSQGFFLLPSTTTFFGAVTEAALKQYQASVGLGPVGIVGPRTRALLNAAAPRPSTQIAALIAQLQMLLAQAGISTPVESLLNEFADTGTDTASGKEESASSPTPSVRRSGGSHNSNEAPTISNISPAENATVGGTAVTLSVDATDDEAVERVKFYVDGALVGEDTAAPYAITWDSTAFSDGSHSLEVTAEDSITEASVAVVFTVDNSAPVNSSASAGTPTASSTIISWTTDELAYVAVGYGTTSTYGSTTATTTSLATAHAVSITGLRSNTTYHYRIFTLDAVGNLAVSGDQTFTTEYDSDALALFARMSSAPDSSRKALMNTLITDLKTAGVWSKMDIFYMLAAHDAQAGRLNWMGNDTFNLAVVGSPVFTTDRGYQSSITASSSLATNWTPSSSAVRYTLNNAEHGVYVNTSEFTIGGPGASTEMGADYSQIGAMRYNNLTGVPTQIAGRINRNATLSTTTPSILTAIGLTQMGRSAATSVQIYRNAVQVISNGAASIQLDTTPWSILAASNGAHSIRRVAFAFAGANLTSSERTALYNAVLTYLTALGAQ